MHGWTELVFNNQRIILLVHFISLSVTANSADYENQEEEQPTFLPRATNVSFNKGDTAILVCGIENLGTKTVIWRRASDPNPLTIGSHVYVGDPRYSAKGSPENKEWRLFIEDVRSTDAGVYECQISSRAKLIHHILLRVESAAIQERKEHISYAEDDEEVSDTHKSSGIFVSGSKFVEKDDPIHLVCNSSGVLDAPDNLDWFKDGVKITPDGLRQIKIDKFHVPATRTLVSVLQIRHSKMDDAGTYVCRSSDLSTTSIKVHVLNAAGSVNVRRGTLATDKAETGKKHQNSVEIVQREASKEDPKSAGSGNSPSVLMAALLLCGLLLQGQTLSNSLR